MPGRPQTRMLVVAHNNARDVAELLRGDFPTLQVTVVADEEQAEPFRAETEVLLTIGHLLTRPMVARMPNLTWVQSLISGVENLTEALRGRDVLLTSAAGVHGSQVAEMALTHMLVLSRDIGRLIENQRTHVWNRAQGQTGRLLAGKTVGVVGLGAIGRTIAPACKALGMTVFGVSDSARDVRGVDRHFPRSGLAEVAGLADHLVLAVPLTQETRGLIDAEIFGAMKPTAYLINMARGGVVDEGALIEALRAGSIAGAGLDTVATEPLPEGSPLWDLDGVLITPHVAGAFDGYAEQIYTVVKPNMERYLRGDREAMINVIPVGRG